LALRGRKWREAGRPEHRLKDNIRMDLRERVGSSGLGSFGSGQGEVTGLCVHCNEPSGSIKGGGSFQ